MKPARRLLVPVLLLAIACGSNGSSGGSWSCDWRCTANGTTGSHTYPSGPDPTGQCAIDYGSSCGNFSCSCTRSELARAGRRVPLVLEPPGKVAEGQLVQREEQ